VDGSVTLEHDMTSANGQTLANWAAIAGRWEFTEVAARYLGPGPGGAPHPVGLAKGAPRFRDGTIECRVKLARIEKTSGGFFFGFKSEEDTYFAAALGSYDRAYSVLEFQPGAGWFRVASTGWLSNLTANVAYHLRVSVTGQSIRVTVNDIEVLTTVAPSPLDGTGFGLFTWDDAEVEFTDVRISGTTPRIFVIMPFSEPYETLYRDVIQPVAKRLEFDIVRVDEIVGPGMIIADIQRQIESAHAVVAEISSHNPNVYYELGYAHALHKPAVLLWRRQQDQAMPFDVSGYRAIFYDDSNGGKKTVERNLEQHLGAILGAA
jgi:hypothetical protein